jgi:hypothetical protein
MIRYIMAASPSTWLDYSDELFDAAEELYENPNKGFSLQTELTRNQIVKTDSFTRTCLLLLGFAMENAIKGLFICENPQFVDGEEGVNAKVFTHNLIKLGEGINGLKFTEHEKQILSRLTKVISFSGRYPIPHKDNEIDIYPELSTTFYNEIKVLHQKIQLKNYLGFKNGWSNSGPFQYRLQSSSNSKYDDLAEKLKFDGT